MEQAERLDILLERFAADARFSRRDTSGLRTTREKRDALRAMMNVRMPTPLDDDTLRLQDEYLAARAQERGIVELSDIPVIGGGVVSVWKGDITLVRAGAIVNAANDRMLGCFQPLHNCIDNCIHTFAGVELRLECERQMEEQRSRYGRGYLQPTAAPMLTPGYNLPAEHVIHIVGPVIDGEVTRAQRAELAACYTNTLELCAENDIKSVAFCCISTGVFRFPKDLAAQIAVDTVSEWLAENPGCMERVVFCVHNDGDLARYERVAAGRGRGA